MTIQEDLEELRTPDAHVVRYPKPGQPTHDGVDCPGCAALARITEHVERLEGEREGWEIHAKAMETEMMKHASEVARLSRYEKALREV